MELDALIPSQLVTPKPAPEPLNMFRGPGKTGTSKTSITYEYPANEGDPCYPIPRPENAALYRRYKRLADATAGVWFVGRLATYRYYNMDQVVGQALATFRRIQAAIGD